MATPLSWVLVGRQAELERIAHARQQGRVGVIVHGSAGLGKSRLAREALASAEQDGATVGWIQATRSAAAVPLGAFASVIPPTIRSDDPFELMQRSAEALRERAGGRPLVLGLDDAQWLDPTSAALALHLASTATAFPVVTVRSGETCPDAIVSLWKDAGAPRFELGLLSGDETEALVEAIAGGPVEREVSQWVSATSGGNALYVRELVAGALETGALKQVDGLWRMPLRPPVGESLSELVAARMAGLGESEQLAVELLALGEPLRLSEMLSLAGSLALTSLQTHGLLDVDDVTPDGAVRLSHPLYGEVMRAQLPSLRARELRLRLAQTVQARSMLDPEDTVRVTRWLIDAGESISTQLMIEAARAASQAGDPLFGAALASRALAAGAGIEASLLLARAHSVQGRFELAEEVLAGAQDTVRTQHDALQYLEQQSEVLHWGLGRPAELRALLDRAVGWWPGQEWRQGLEPLRLLVTQFEELRSGQVRPAELLAGDDLTPDVRRRLEPIHVANLLYGGQTREAHALAERIRPELPMRTITDVIALSLWSRVTLEDGERWAELEEWMSTALDTAVRLGDHAAAGQAAYSLGCLRTLTGRLFDAGLLLAEATAQFERHDPLGLLCVVDAQQTVVAAQVGDPVAATAALERCQRRLTADAPLAHQLPYVVRAQAWVAHADGERRRAQTLLLDAAEALHASPVHAAGLSYEAMRVGAEARALAEPLAQLRERSDARLVAAYAAHATARAAQDGRELLLIVDEFEQIGALRYASEAAADAAEAFLSEGREDSARQAAARRRELFVENQGAALPSIEGLDAAVTGLTARESELVGLASMGLSNAEIAERLVLSVRTVESHLYRAMQKLGISNRRAL